MDDQTKKIIYNISSNPSVNFLRYKPYHLERDIYSIISIIFNVESAFRLGKEIGDIEIEISNETYELLEENLENIKEELESLMKFVMLKSVDISLVKKDLNKGRRNKKMDFSSCENICLFSGGVDSLSGLLLSLKEYQGNVETFSVIHGDQGKTLNILNPLFSLIDPKNKFKKNIMHAPRMYSEGYSQLRGFFYAMGASIYANLKNSKRVIIAECGPTMYQMRFSPFDSITMTTHPFVLSKVKNLIRLFFNKKIDIVLPFENLTKAEVASLNPLPKTNPFSHSCVGSRWIKSNFRKDSDGVCYGCILRRLGVLTAGLKDTKYEKNPLMDKKAYADHLLNLLDFSVEFLIDRNQMQYCQLENIERFKKEELFERFSLDNICALHVLVKKGLKLNPKIEHMYEEAKSFLGVKKLEERIANVRHKNYSPNFKKKV